MLLPAREGAVGVSFTGSPTNTFQTGLSVNCRRIGVFTARLGMGKPIHRCAS